MRSQFLGASCVIFTIIFSVYGQVVLKIRLSQLSSMPAGFLRAAVHLLSILFDPVIASTFIAAFLAALCWMAALDKFELSKIYPFTSLNFVTVVAIGVLFLGESWSWNKGIGITLIVIGSIVLSADFGGGDAPTQSRKRDEMSVTNRAGN